MKSRLGLAFVIYLILLTACQAGETVPSLSPEGSNKVISPAAGTLSGFVLDENGAVAGAVVRQKTTENETLTDEEGYFELEELLPDQPTTITAWAEGYLVGWVEDPLTQKSPLIINLKPFYTYDDDKYNWFSTEGEEGSLSCSHCMPCYTEWQKDAHSQSAVNPRFLSMYNGTDLDGNQSPATRYVTAQDYGQVALSPDPNQPYYGPGYKLDFPDSAGNCATCHVPAQAAHPGMAYHANPNLAVGIELEGVFCEFCHKIGDVTLDSETGLPYPNLPGVLSLRLYRPSGEDQLFFGNLDDVTRRVSKLPLESESAFCAACHFGVFWDVPIYNSFGEWLDSPYSDPISGRTCQDCHMAPVNYPYIVFPEQGGLIRDPKLIKSHYMPGAADQNFLSEAVDLQAGVLREEDRIRVDVVLINDNTGHKIPTDSPLRQMLLLISAKDSDGNELTLIEGPRIPTWGGEGGPQSEGYYAGLPGKGYALILEEKWTRVSPTGAYWNPVTVLEDTRIDPFQVDRSSYFFQVKTDQEVQVEVSLFFRRAYKELMDQKGWTDDDILIKEIILQQK